MQQPNASNGDASTLCISEHEMEEVMHASTAQLMLLVAFAEKT